jgi:hypothetical protein
MQARYLDSVARVYPNQRVDSHTLVAQPGESYDLEHVPTDGRWEVEGAQTLSAPSVVVDPPSDTETVATASSEPLGDTNG